MQIISAEVICIVQFMAILMAANVSDNAIDYTMVTLIALFLIIWLIFYLFNVVWKDDDDLAESHVSIQVFVVIIIIHWIFILLCREGKFGGVS